MAFVFYLSVFNPYTHILVNKLIFLRYKYVKYVSEYLRYIYLGEALLKTAEIPKVAATAIFSSSSSMLSSSSLYWKCQESLNGICGV